MFVENPPFACHLFKDQGECPSQLKRPVLRGQGYRAWSECKRVARPQLVDVDRPQRYAHSTFRANRSVNVVADSFPTAGDLAHSDGCHSRLLTYHFHDGARVEFVL